MKRKKLFLILFTVIAIPSTGLAFLGIGDSGDLLLGKILAELIYHSTTLRNLLTGMDYLNHLQSDIRRGIEDPLPLEVNGLPIDAEQWMTQSLPELAGLPVLGEISSYDDITSTVHGIWGGLPLSIASVSLGLKDYQAIHSLGQAAVIANQASEYFQAGDALLSDLEHSHEAKAVLRSAQTQALQVQQLSRVQANQGLQISLQAQEALSRNEGQKGIQEFNDNYLDMLINGFSGLSPMGPRP